LLREAEVLRGLLAPAIVAAVLGASLLVPLGTNASGGTMRIGAVQGNVAEPGLGAFANAYEVLSNHVAGTEALVADPTSGDLDLVVWPENASDYNPRVNADAQALVEQASQAAGVPLLVGTDRYEDGDEIRERYNEIGRASCRERGWDWGVADAWRQYN